MIKLQHICKLYTMGSYEFRALNQVDLKISQGEFISICGASGSGKTTLLNIMGLVDSFEEGSYYFKGIDTSKLDDSQKAAIRNREIGFVLQDFALINSQTVLYNVMLPLLFSKCPYMKMKRRALEALELVGIKDQAEKRANQLSGGQRQRVAIARAIVNSPSIILADEPTGQLDTETGKQIMELLANLNQKGISVVVVTHDREIAKMTSRIIEMSDGEITNDCVDPLVET